MNTLNNLKTDIQYEYKVIKQLTIMAIFWGIIGMSIGVFVASELVWPDLNNGISWLSFGRLRPLHKHCNIRFWCNSSNGNIILCSTKNMSNYVSF